MVTTNQVASNHGHHLANPLLIVTMVTPFLQLFSLYEEHLRHTAVSISEEQNKLTRTIKDHEGAVAQILGTSIIWISTL